MAGEAALSVRLAAAARLLGRSATEPELAGELERLMLRGPGSGSDLPGDTPPRPEAGTGSVPGSEVLMRAIADDSSPPAWAQRVVLARVAGGTEDERVAAIAALGSFRTRESVKYLVGEPLDSSSRAVRAAALAALGRITGRGGATQLGSSARRWRDWFAGVEFLSEGEWRGVLAEGLGERSDRLARSLETAVSRLTLQARDEFAASEGPRRVEMLLELMRDELAAMRLLGVRLANQELANARSPGPAVGEMCVELLGDPSPEIRAQAAELVAALAAAGAGPAVERALAAESDANAAASLLRAAARWAGPSALAPALRWAGESSGAGVNPGGGTNDNGPGPADAGSGGERGGTGGVGGALEPALDVLVQIVERGLVTGEKEKDDILGVVRSLSDEFLTQSALRLLVELGGAQDRARVEGVLERGEAGSRLAAASALATRADAVDAIVRAAAKDDGLFTLAASATARFAADVSGVARIAALPAPSQEVRRETLAELAQALPPPQQLALARSLDDGPLREVILTRLVAAGQADRGTGPLGEPAGRGYASSRATLVAASTLLARTRLDLGKPEEALAALDAMHASDGPAGSSSRAAEAGASHAPGQEGGAPAARTGYGITLEAELRTEALLWLNRIDEAREQDVSVQVWLDALERIEGLPHAMRVADAIWEQSGEVLTDAQYVRLERLGAQIAQLRARDEMSFGPPRPPAAQPDRQRPWERDPGEGDPDPVGDDEREPRR